MKDKYKQLGYKKGGIIYYLHSVIYILAISFS